MCHKGQREGGREGEREKEGNEVGKEERKEGKNSECDRGKDMDRIKEESEKERKKI